MRSSNTAVEHRRPLVRRGEISPHEPLRVGRGSPCGQNLHKGPRKHLRMPQDRQRTLHSVHQSDGGHKVTRTVQSSHRAVAVVPTTRDNPICCPSPRSAKLHSRRGVQDYALVSRVDAREIDLPQYHSDPGPMHSGPVCHKPQQPTGQVCQLAPRPVCDGNGRLCYVMAGGARRPLQPGTPVSGLRKTSASRLESIRNIHLAEGLSEWASALICSGWSKGTNTAYKSGWSKWASWCTARQIDPISGDVQHFVDILVDLYDQGLQHRSIKTQSGQRYQ